MTEKTESLDQPSIVPDLRETVVDRRPSRLNQVAAWVAIVAGIVFIVGSVFFTGFILGRHSGGHGHGGWQHHRGGSEMQFRGGPPMMPMMPMGPGMGGPGMGPRMGPGMGPDRDQGPGPAQPPAPPSSAAPRP
ncbi:MAG: hypothetical protein ACOYBX_11315 [Mycobacterium sp.]